MPTSENLNLAFSNFHGTGGRLETVTAIFCSALLAFLASAVLVYIWAASVMSRCILVVSMSVTSMLRNASVIALLGSWSGVAESMSKLGSL